ncbi:protease Do-like 8, chloroplastic isoform X1 [Vigna radiata var. radiata]|uniref:Protease Do-like 8, chloroplastic isoform X1 n=1 Tax=Vigna radiata var. radiata TaxID=3916 RepID=A0A1S3UJZ9_VIGRR|nr:protease Do-like 8, chloroplastic isoform X1 [Vigna radiata var. radiata]
MQVLSACNLWSVGVPIHTRRRSCVLSRREICFDGMSSVCSHSQNSSNDAISSTSGSTIQVQDKTLDFDEMVKNLVLSPTRRVLVASLTMFSCLCSSRYMSALALGDPSVTLEEVTPPVFSSGPLFPIEDRIVRLFERNTYSVVNIFDVTLRPQLNITGVVEIPEGNGSGVVWDEEGHIVTNYHVVGNALSKNPKAGEVVARVNILASEGLQKNFEGVLIGADRLKDLAVLKVDAPKDILRPIKVGQSSSLKVGQQCLAIGNPFGFDHTLTVGVISGLNRDIFSQTGVTIGGGVQTDAAINPGNSGGPLLNSKGSLIGINTAIFTQTGTSAGVGFAIPSSTVLRIVPQLIQFGKVVRAGINVDIAPDLIANQLNVRNGALVLLVPANSLAAKAGLNPTTRGFAGNIVLGDIIVAVDNKPVKSKAELLKALDEYNVGDKVVLMVQRGSEKLELPVVLEEQSS